jgi:hypothetical protein
MLNGDAVIEPMFAAAFTGRPSVQHDPLGEAFTLAPEPLIGLFPFPVP